MISYVHPQRDRSRRIPAGVPVILGKGESVTIHRDGTRTIHLPAPASLPYLPEHRRAG